jgi:GT2 family glycosyltransferase
VVPSLGARPELLRRTLASIRDQALPGVHCVVVAGSEVPGLAADVAGLGAELVLQRTPGLSQAINEGWAHRGAEFDAWTWLGDDDELLPGSLLRSTGALVERPSASMVYGRCRYVDVDGRALWTARPGRFAAAIAPWGPNLIPQPGSLLRAAAVRRAGVLDPTLRYAMDIDLFLRLRRVGELVYVPHELALFRWHEGSTTVANQAASDRELAAVLARYRPVPAPWWEGAARAAARTAGQVAYHLDRARTRSVRR